VSLKAGGTVDNCQQVAVS